MFGFAINNWLNNKLGFSNKIKAVPCHQHGSETSPELHGLPPSYESILWADESKVPCIPSATHLSTHDVKKKACPVPARPFPKDWKTSVGPQSGSLKSSGYSCLINENTQRRA